MTKTGDVPGFCFSRKFISYGRASLRGRVNLVCEFGEKILKINFVVNTVLKKIFKTGLFCFLFLCYVTNWEESRIQNIVPLPRPERAKLDVPGRYPLRLTSCPAASGFRPGQVCAMAPMLMVLYHRNSRIAFAHANSISYMLSGCAVR